MIKSLLFFAGTVFLSLNASAETRTCAPITSHALSNYVVEDESHLLYTSRAGDRYEFTVGSGCDLNSSNYIELDPFTSYQICSGDTLSVGETGPCMINDISKQN